MPIKIAGIVTLGLVALGILAFSLLWFDRKYKQQNEERKQRLEEKKQNDDFTLALFNKILLDQDDKVAALRSDVKLRDNVIVELQKQIERMNKNAEKLNLKEALNK